MHIQPGEKAPRIPVFLVLGLIAAVLAMVDLAPDRTGPGVTCDELYHIGYGKRLVASALKHGLWNTNSDRIREVYSWTSNGPPVHPPLGNWLLGWTHWIFDPDPLDLTVLAITPARFASALALGVLVCLVSWFVANQYGMASGAAAAVATVLMPRLFGHAHLATLDIFTALTCTAAVIMVSEAHRRSDSLWWYALAGGVWGLALLTRFHGLLVGIPIGIWILWAAQRRRLRALALWGITGVLTLFVGWPWLWLNPFGNLRLYIVGSTVRSPIHTFYASQAWNDIAVPWHYPWVTFAVTIPIGLLVLGAVGVCAALRARPVLFTDTTVTTDTAPATRITAATNTGAAASPDIGANPREAERRSRSFWLLLGAIVFFLVLFSAPGVPIYDGERLLLPVFPLWAVFVGMGAKAVVNFPSRRWAVWPASRRWAIVASFLLLQGLGILWFRPAWLSYYNGLVGGLCGAKYLGFEVNYWGDGVTEDLLRQVAERCQEGEVVGFAPSLAPFQAPALVLASPSLAERQVRLIGWTRDQRPRLLVLYHRRADLAEVPASILDHQPVAEVRRQGIWLARVVELPPDSEGSR